MLRRAYNWTMALAARKSAEAWMALISFVESSVFPIPVDVLFIPMVLARPDRAWRYATVATVTSIAGGVLGWYIGHYAYDAIARPILEFYGRLEDFEALRTSATSRDAVLILLITSGLAHLPPIKVVTILSGAVGIDLWLFIASAIVARGARFFLLAWLIRRYGEPIRLFIERRLGWVAAAVAGALAVLYLVFRMA